MLLPRVERETAISLSNPRERGTRFPRTRSVCAQVIVRAAASGLPEQVTLRTSHVRT
jgi:hypothetical protein